MTRLHCLPYLPHIAQSDQSQSGVLLFTLVIKHHFPRLGFFPLCVFKSTAQNQQYVIIHFRLGCKQSNITLDRADMQTITLQDQEISSPWNMLNVLACSVRL